MDRIKALLLWGVRKALYLSVAAGLAFLSTYAGTHETNILGIRLDEIVFGLGAVMSSELRRRFVPEFLTMALGGEVPTRY